MVCRMTFGRSSASGWNAFCEACADGRRRKCRPMAPLLRRALPFPLAKTAFGHRKDGPPALSQFRLGPVRAIPSSLTHWKADSREQWNHACFSFYKMYNDMSVKMSPAKEAPSQLLKPFLSFTEATRLVPETAFHKEVSEDPRIISGSGAKAHPSVAAQTGLVLLPNTILKNPSEIHEGERSDADAKD